MKGKSSRSTHLIVLSAMHLQLQAAATLCFSQHMATWAKIHTCKKQSGLDCTGTFCLYVAFPFVFHTLWPAEPSNIHTCKKIEQFSLIIDYLHRLLIVIIWPRYTEAYAKSLFNLKYNATDDDVAVELDDCEVDFSDNSEGVIIWLHLADVFCKASENPRSLELDLWEGIRQPDRLLNWNAQVSWSPANMETNCQVVVFSGLSAPWKIIIYLWVFRNLLCTRVLSISFHSDAVMFERLLSMIYRSHNVYCIHVDLKAR